MINRGEEYWRKRWADHKLNGESYSTICCWDEETIEDEKKNLIADISKFINPEKTILDYGCGEGRFAKHFNPENYRGMDIIPEVLQAARDKNPGYIFQLIENGPQGYFESGMLITVFQCIPFEDKARIARMMRERCKGLLMISSDNEKSTNAYHQTEEQLITLMADCGWKLFISYESVWREVYQVRWFT
jgi:SAM-dependent methyltransferase